MRSRRKRQADGKARVDRVGRVRRFVERGVQVVVSANRGETNPPAVERQFHRMRMLETAEVAEVRAEEPHLHVVLGVDGKRMANHDATHRPERQAFDVLILRQVLANAECLGDRRCVDVADGQTANRLGGRQVSFLERRRHAQHIGDVVEAVRGVVRREQRGDVYVEREQIANRVRVLGAIEAVQQRTAGMRVRLRGAIEFAFEPRRQRVIRILIGPARALRRHRAGVEFPQHVLPEPGVGRDAREIGRVEYDARRRRRCLRTRVVTADAVLAEELTVRLLGG